MRHSIKRISKSALSVILALMMVVSTMVVGTISSVNAATFVPNSKIYLDVSNKTYWTEAGYIYMYLYQGGTSEFVKMNKVDGESYIYEGTVKNSNNENIIFLRNKNDEGNWSQWNQTVDIIDYDGTKNMYSLSSTDSSETFKDTDGKENVNKQTGNWSTYGGSTGGDDPTAVTDTNLLSVLKGKNVMFYGGELTEWDQSTFLVMNTNITSDIAASGTMTGNYNLSSQGSTQFAAFCLPSKDYYMGHWNSGLHTTVEEGAAYIVRGSTSGTGFTQKSQSGSNYLYSYNNGATLTATTTCTLNDDGTLTVNTSSDKGTSTIGLPNSFKYYITSDNSTFTEYALTDGKLDTSSLADGTYTLKTVLTDGNIYVVGDTDTFTVSSATTYTISASAYDSSKGTVTVNGSQLNPSASVTTTNTTFNISVTPSTGYTLSSLTIGDTVISLRDDQKSDGYSKASYSISGNLTITPVFSAISSSTNYYVAGSEELTGKSWDAAGTQMTETSTGSGIYTTTFNGVSTAINTNMFKITTGKWGTNGTDEFNSDYLDTSDSATAAICSSYGNDKNILITLNTQSDVTITFNSNTNKITVSAGSNKTQLVPPTISAPESIGAEEESVTLTVSDMSYPSDAGIITYVLYKNGEELDSSKDRTFSISQEGTYEVKAVPDSSSNYIASELSEAKTIKKLSAESYNLYIKGDSTAYPMVKNSSGIYISEKTVADSSVLFYIQDVAKSKYSDSGAGSNSWYIKSEGENSGGKVSAWLDTAPTVGVDMYSNHTGSEKYVAYNPTTQKVFLVSGGSSVGSANVYAKNGTIGGTASFGTTVAEAANTSSTVTYSSSDTGYKKYTAKVGSSVKVTTTMAAAVNSERYVHAFVVNGKTYLATEGIADSEDNKTYYAQFVIEEGVSNYEVTPVYYVNDCKTEGNYVTFYVNASELDGETYNWGNTIASYAYYYKGNVEADGVLMSDGTYPGQPLLFDEGQNSFYCRVPKTMSDGTGSYSVTGMTINNYYNDSLHRSLSSLTAHEQSYDYNDFKLISEFGYDIIRFDMKPRNTANNKTKIGLSDQSTSSTDSPADNHTIKIAEFASNTGNGWEYFVDNNNNKVDAVGNKVDSSVTKKLYVVSTARYNYSGVGVRSTKWFIYAANSADATTATLVASGLPSDFIPRANPADNTNSYNIINNNYAGAETMITFEQIKDVDSALRMDGRWYYAKTTQNVTVKAGYVLGDSTTINVNADYVNINGTEKEVEIKNGSEVSLTASPLAGYTFVGWMTYDTTNDKFVSLSSTLGSSFTTQLNSDVYYVAKYIPAVEGSLIISHSAYNGSDKKGGLGYYYVKADLYDQNGDLKTSQIGTGTGNNGQSISFTNLESTDTKIVITISTETAGENTFRYWYTTSSNGYEIIEDPDGNITWNGTATYEPTGKSGTLTYTFETEVWKLFNADYSKQVVTQMNFYSDIAPMTKNYKLTYIYDDRFGNQKSYVVTDTHDDSYYVKNKNSWAPNEELIYAKAPYIDDLYKDCTWTMAQCTKDGTDATLTAVQTGKKYTVKIYDSTGEAYDPYQLAINSYVKNKAGQFYVADAEDSSGKKFNYWSVTENGIEVTRQYQRMYTLVVLGNYDIKPVYGEKAATDAVYISKPQYTREQTKSEDGKIVTDKLYVDFMLSYMSADGSLIMKDPEKYDTGVLIEFGQHRKFTEKPDGTLNINYADNEYNSDTNKLIEAATGTASKVKYTYSGDDAITNDNRVIYKYDINEEKYNNMNRLDYFASFVNSPGNQKYVYKAYYYVRVKNADGTYSDPIISEHVYFNLYEVGTSEPKIVNSSTTS